MIGPKGHEGVWFKNSWTKTAHRLGGDRKNINHLPCGLKFWDGNDFIGEVIRWDHLDQQKVELCKICWKGYEPVYNRTINELKWWGARNILLTEIFKEAWTVISTPTHLDQMKVEGPGGNVVFEGTMLNYSTLKEMLTIMLQEETHRKNSRGRMAKLMQELLRWENEHPYGEPIVEDEAAMMAEHAAQQTNELNA
jgi:hypothetical protein